MNTNRYFEGFLTVLMLLMGTATARISSGDADLILFNGKIITVDSQDQIFEAVAVKEGKILALGNSHDIMGLAGINCRLIDLKGKTVTPGLVDSHYHVLYYGQQFWEGYLNIRYPVVRSKADLLQAVSDRATQLEKDVWISGNQGFHLALDEELDRWDLDGVAPRNPVYLRHGSGQYAVVNSRALEIAGIDSLTSNPPASLILRDSLQRPTGILSHYPAENMVGQYATGYGDRSLEQRYSDIELGQQLCLEAGYTSAQDVIVGKTEDILLYRDFALAGKLRLRLYAMLYLNTEDQAMNLAVSFKPENTGLFTFGGWKLAMDGGITARTILMYDTTQYMAQICYPYYSQESLNRVVHALHKTGLQVAVHVSGDRGIDMTLTAFEEAMKSHPRADPRHRIEHGFFPSPEALDRMKASGVIVSTQPQWITWHGDSYVKCAGTAAIERMLPLKTMVDMGIPVAFGCDVPASIAQEPRYAFAGSVFRRPASQTTLNPDQRLTIREALRIHTMGSSYASFSEKITGSLEPGKLADLVVWSHDLYTMVPADYLNLKSEMTIVNGEIEFNAGTLTVSTNLGNTAVGSEGFSFPGNFPNPFTRMTTFHFKIPAELEVELIILDQTGKTIRNLSRGIQETGSHTVFWDGTDNSGSEVPGGLYICSMKSGNFLAWTKVVRIR